MSSWTFGETIEGLAVDGRELKAAVFNENGVRAAAGLTMVIGVDRVLVRVLRQELRAAAGRDGVLRDRVRDPRDAGAALQPDGRDRPLDGAAVAADDLHLERLDKNLVGDMHSCSPLSSFSSRPEGFEVPRHQIACGKRKSLSGS